MSQHTQEPWIVTGSERVKYVEARIGNGLLQEIATCMIVEHGNHAENARRIVACVNACAGLDTRVLENIVMLGDTIKGRFSLLRQELEAKQ